MGSANTVPGRGALEPEYTLGSKGQPYLDDTIEIVFLGFGAKAGYGPNVGPDVVFEGTGKPINVGG